MRNRRDLVGAVGTGLAALAGCLGLPADPGGNESEPAVGSAPRPGSSADGTETGSDETDGDDEPDDGSSAENRSDDESNGETEPDDESSAENRSDDDPYDSPDDPPERDLRRGASSADVHRREVVDSDDVEYLGDGAVEIVTVRSGDEAVATETRPFEEWAETHCRSVAADAVSDHVRDRLNDPEGIGGGFGYPTDEREELAAIVTHTTSFDRDGDLASEPQVTYDRLVEVTPREASATIELADREHACTTPAYVRREWLQLD